MSIHIGAKKGDIAETVLLPGDPLRAKWIAETFLEDVVCYNEVRGMYGFTGTYKGKRVSVQGTGMGIPSTLIYAHELINEFGVKNLIRVGSAGSYQKDVEIRDVVIAMSASTDSGINTHRFNGSFAPTASAELFLKAVEIAKNKDIKYKAGNIMSSDKFYTRTKLMNVSDPSITVKEQEYFKQWADFGVLCVEMEAAGLYTVAAQFNVNALALLTISDSLVTGETTTSQEREQTFKDMIEIALGLA